MVQLSHSYMTVGKAIALTVQTSVGKVMSLLFMAEPVLQASSLSPTPQLEGAAWGALGAQPQPRACSRAGPTVVGRQDEEEPCPGEGPGLMGG